MWFHLTHIELLGEKKKKLPETLPGRDPASTPFSHQPGIPLEGLRPGIPEERELQTLLEGQQGFLTRSGSAVPGAEGRPQLGGPGPERQQHSQQHSSQVWEQRGGPAGLRRAGARTGLRKLRVAGGSRMEMGNEDPEGSGSRAQSPCDDNIRVVFTAHLLWPRQCALFSIHI